MRKIVSKYHGAGNDFIISSDIVRSINLEKYIRAICDRRFGIGADGFMFPGKSSDGDIFMHFYNADGSQAEMCGNGLRCFSKFVYDNKLVKSRKFNVDTLAGKMNVNVIFGDNEDLISRVSVFMGKPEMLAKNIPVKTVKREFIEEIIDCAGRSFKVSSIRIGVPHAVIEVDNILKEDVMKFGPLLENHEIFPERTNVNFVKIIDENTLEIDTWERGAGNTLACGTGASASAYIIHFLKKTKDKVVVKTPGGQLEISVDESNCVSMTGEACRILKGEFYYGF